MHWIMNKFHALKYGYKMLTVLFHINIIASIILFIIIINILSIIINITINIIIIVIITPAMAKVMFSSLSVALFVGRSACLLATLRENGWADFHDFLG